MPHVRARRRRFKFPDWDALIERNPDGLNDAYASIRAVKMIVSRLQSTLTARGYLIALDETDMADDVPEAIILSDGGTTTLIHLSFRRPKLVSVGGEPVYVAHDDGALMLASAIEKAVKTALR
ncbi:MAG: hypothetical protein ACREHE_00935 [Rhizomicrobium sp.]